MFQKGKLSRYFGYAFGEIVLIVVGILIALQISNWNETRKNEQLGEELTKKLYAEMLETHAYSLGKLDELQLQAHTIETFLNEGENMDKEALKQKMSDGEALPWNGISAYVFQVSINYVPPHSVYSAAVNDGSIALVDNQEFQFLLEEIYINRPEEMKDQYIRETRISDDLRVLMARNYSDRFHEFMERQSQGDVDAMYTMTLEFLQDNEIRYHLRQKRSLIRGRARRLNDLFIQPTEELIKSFQP